MNKFIILQDGILRLLLPVYLAWVLWTVARVENLSDKYLGETVH